MTSRSLFRPRAVAMLLPCIAIVSASCGDGDVGKTDRGGAAGAAIGGAAAGSAPDGGGTRGDGNTTAGTSAELTYGRAPSQDGRLEYQPDVVIVGGGAASIRAASVDGVSWLIDGRAPHAGEIVEGKVMFLTTRAVGRVLRVERRGVDLAVVLGPFEITDVIRNGRIKVHQAIAAGTVVTQLRPNAPDAVRLEAPALSSTAFGGTRGEPAQLVMRPVSLVLVGQDAPQPPPATEGFCAAGMQCTLPPATRTPAGSVKVEPFTFEAEFTDDSKTVGVNGTVSYSKPGTMEWSGVLGVTFDKGAIDVDCVIQGGKVTSSHAHLVGLRSVRIKAAAGSVTGEHTAKARLAFPIEYNIPVPAEPPFNLNFQFKAIVELAWTGKNSTISGEGEITFDGSPLGIDISSSGSTLRDGGAKVSKEPVDHIEGVSMGPTGFVFAAQLKVLYGLGTSALSAGPFAAVTVSTGLTNGSSIGIVQCKQASVDVVVGGGVGYKIEPAVVGVLKAILPDLKIGSEASAGYVSKSVLHGVKSRPEVAACRAAPG